MPPRNLYTSFIMTKMAPPDPPLSALDVLKVLADDTRWRLIGALRRSDLQVGELVQQLRLPQNLISYHLGQLRQVGLVRQHRSDADARATYYGLDLVALQGLVSQLGATLLLPLVAAPLPAVPPTVVFLCTANSARSQMAEGWLRHLSGGRVIARSAGTAPATLHPLATAAMAELGVDIGYQVAKGMRDLEGVQPDVVVTVCDIAREECGTFLRAPAVLHWSIPDPVRAAGSNDDQRFAFQEVRDELQTRVLALLALLPALPRGTP
jgi:ArsR family transcriptional regulator